MDAAGDVAVRLKALSARHLYVAPAELTVAATLTNDLGLDSLAAIEWGMVIEDEFGVRLPEAAWRDLTTYGDVQRFVEAAASRRG